jgi:hypothetical protein
MGKLRTTFAALVLALVALACGGEPQTVEVEVTRIVPQTVEVTRAVPQTVEVTRMVQVIVTATPPPASPTPEPTSTSTSTTKPTRAPQPTVTPAPPTATVTGTSTATPKPTATTPKPTAPVPPPPSSTPTPTTISLVLSGMRYEQWGRPVEGCRRFDNKSAVRKFNVEITLTNNSTQAIKEWYPDFYANTRRLLLTCYYVYGEGFPPVSLGEERTVTFASFAELDEYVSEMRMTVLGNEYRRCFSPEGEVMPCP